jgi:hypothetical protein
MPKNKRIILSHSSTSSEDVISKDGEEARILVKTNIFDDNKTDEEETRTIKEYKIREYQFQKRITNLENENALLNKKLTEALDREASLTDKMWLISGVHKTPELIELYQLQEDIVNINKLDHSDFVIVEDYHN